MYILDDLEKTKGKKYSVAVMSWTTASGQVTPILMKYRTEDDDVAESGKIEVMTHKQTLYNGIQFCFYECKALIGESVREFRLLYFPKNYEWKLIV